ncbi:MAG: DMT family transporter [Rhodoluna sp.]|nr:DMT family transporter [Rhodoluna sp.]
MTKSRLAALALLAVAISWGAGFVLMEPAIERQPIFNFLAFRFTLAVIVMVAVRPSVLKKFNKTLLLQGGVLGLALGGGYVAQTIGLLYSTAAITGFYTGLYVALTPLFAWLLLRNRISAKALVGVILATIGLAILSSGAIAFGWGEISLLICAVLFALHIIGLGVWSAKHDSYALTIVQLTMCAMLSWAGALTFEGGVQPPPDAEVWFAIIFTAVLATALAFFVQTWAQGFLDPSRVAIILTSEVVWAAVIAYGVGQEKPEFLSVLGGSVMLTAMLIVEWPSKKKELVPLEPMAH